jgi:hypothetical protein
MTNPFEQLSGDEVATRVATCRRLLIRLGQVRVPIGRELTVDELTEVEFEDRSAHAKALADSNGQSESAAAAAVEAAALRREFEVLDYLLEHPHASLPSVEDLGFPPDSEGPVVVMPVGGPSQSAVLTLPRHGHRRIAASTSYS